MFNNLELNMASKPLPSSDVDKLFENFFSCHGITMKRPTRLEKEESDNPLTRFRFHLCHPFNGYHIDVKGSNFDLEVYNTLRKYLKRVGTGSTFALKFSVRCGRIFADVRLIPPLFRTIDTDSSGNVLRETDWFLR